VITSAKTKQTSHSRHLEINAYSANSAYRSHVRVVSLHCTAHLLTMADNCTLSSSGKSLVYNTAVIDDLLTRPDAVAMYIFPTKALAQDQVRYLMNTFYFPHAPHLCEPLQVQDIQCIELIMFTIPCTRSRPGKSIHEAILLFTFKNLGACLTHRSFLCTHPATHRCFSKTLHPVL
jgi:hypothetical protein